MRLIKILASISLILIIIFLIKIIWDKFDENSEVNEQSAYKVKVTFCADRDKLRLPFNSVILENFKNNRGNNILHCRNMDIEFNEISKIIYYNNREKSFSRDCATIIFKNGTKIQTELQSMDFYGITSNIKQKTKLKFYLSSTKKIEFIE